MEIARCNILYIIIVKEIILQSSHARSGGNFSALPTPRSGQTLRYRLVQCTITGALREVCSLTEFMRWLVALELKLRLHMIRFHGVLGSTPYSP